MRLRGKAVPSSFGRATAPRTTGRMDRLPRQVATRDSRYRRQPRLLLRFAAASLVLFVAIGIGLSQYISRAFVQREEQAARVHAQFVADSILRYEISPKELAFLTP